MYTSDGPMERPQITSTGDQELQETFQAQHYVFTSRMLMVSEYSTEIAINGYFGSDSIPFILGRRNATKNLK